MHFMDELDHCLHVAQKAWQACWTPEVPLHHDGIEKDMWRNSTVHLLASHAELLYQQSCSGHCKRPPILDSPHLSQLLLWRQQQHHLSLAWPFFMAYHSWTLQQPVHKTMLLLHSS